MEISDLKSFATLLIRYYTIQNLLGFSNEVLCIHVAQGAAKLAEVNLEVRKNNLKFFNRSLLYYACSGVLKHF